ncbi:MFS transporter [Clostridium estertheticum]|uniref:MFS transporter n=1 Tax=Clostridium estertheticum TaxID=238834 RepID=UPI001C0B427B|nr:MFS transporter [Clostridium estertheticum]MBU3215573.1 MFS transporter [Clostridium estertheticum]WAG56809.1 MFS transporter [Clostridium estertheticum]
MNMQSNIGARIDRLPTSKWHYKIFWLIGLGLLIDGFDNCLGGIVLAQLVKNGWSNNYLNAAFTSSTMAGLFIGSLFAGFSGDHLGRKFAYQVNLLIFGIASIAAAFATNMTMLIVLRGLTGIGLGAEIVVGFATFTEFVQAKERGKWAATLSLVGNCAPPLATLIGVIAMPLLGPNYGWRAMFIIGGVAALALWVVRHGFPESPRWYVARGMEEKADNILTNIEKEIELEKGIKLPLVAEQKLNKSRDDKKMPFTSLFKGALLKRTILGCFVLIGMNTALYSITTWIPTIFVKSGITVTKSIIMTTLIMFGAPLGVFIATRIIDKFPRKWMGVTLLIVIAVLGYIYAIQRSEVLIVILGFSLILFLYMYVCFASAVYVPELWPTEIRLRGSGLCNSVGRGVTIFTPYGVAWIMTNYGSVAVFITLGGVLGLVALVIATIGIETKQKSLEEICMEIK